MIIRNLLLRSIMLAYLFTGACLVQAQAILRLSLDEAEALFIQNNLQLLAEKYDVDIARAGVIQSGLHANPTITLSPNLYNPAKPRAFDIGKTGQYEVAVQQLILLAHKRNKAIRLAQAGTGLAEARLYDLLRTLRYTLRSSLIQLYYLQSSVSVYDRELQQLEALHAAYQQLLAKRTVTLKDANRIQSMLYSLLAERTGVQNRINDLEGDIRLLLQQQAFHIIPVVAGMPPDIAVYPLPVLIDSALANRADLKLAQHSVLYQESNYTLQRAMSKPDLTLGAAYDKAGSFVNHATSLTLAMNIPFFNRNQGNIRAAQISAAQSRVNVQYQEAVVKNDVQQAYLKALNTADILTSLDPSFYTNNEKLLAGITENFKKKNIGLLELADFYTSYRNNMLQYNQLLNDRMQAIEAVNYAVGKNIIN